MKRTLLRRRACAVRDNRVHGVGPRDRRPRSGGRGVALRPAAPGFPRARLRDDHKNGTGFEYSLGREIAKAGGPRRSSTCIRAGSATILVGDTKKYDFALEETTITVAAGRVIGFSAPYFNADEA